MERRSRVWDLVNVLLVGQGMEEKSWSIGLFIFIMTTYLTNAWITIAKASRLTDNHSLLVCTMWWWEP